MHCPSSPEGPPRRCLDPISNGRPRARPPPPDRPPVWHSVLRWFRNWALESHPFILRHMISNSSRRLLLYGALDGHPFSGSHVASRRCILSTAAAGALAGVVTAFAEPSSWCVGAVRDVAGCAVWASAAPSSWRIEGCAGCCGGRLTVFAVHAPLSTGRPPPIRSSNPPPPCIVTCELSRVVVLVGETSAQQAAHAVHKRERKACQKPKNGPGRFCKKGL